MNISLKLSIIISIIAGLFLVSSQSNAMILGSSCLLRTVGQHKNKLAFLSDLHALKPDSPIKTSHITDMKAFIQTLTQNKTQIPFVIELCDAFKTDPKARLRLLPYAGSVVTELALDSNMQHKNIKFISFDVRNKFDHSAKDMILKTDDFVQAAASNPAVVSYYKDITIENFLSHLDNRQDLTSEIIESLPSNRIAKNVEYELGKKTYENCHKTIRQLLKKYNVNDQQNFISLIKKMDDSERNKLFFTLIDEQTFSLDTGIVKNMLELSEKNPLCILHGGAAHVNNVEKRLLSQFSGFEKDMPSSMTLPGLNMENLSNVQYPTHIPDRFMNENMKKFITIDQLKE